MNKEDLILLLKRYKENKAKLKLKLRDKENILRQIESIAEIDLSATSLGINSDIHSLNSISDKVGNNASENTDKKANLESKLKEIEEEIRELNSKIEEIDIRLEALKYREREVLIAYYIDGCTYEDIGNRLYYKLFNQTRTSRHIQRLVEIATDKILRLRLKMS